MMEIKYIARNAMTETQLNMIDIINKICFSDSGKTDKSNENTAVESVKDEGHPHGAVELGKFLLFDNDKIVGQVFVHKRLTEYDGQDYYIGGFGGLAVLPEYRGKGYARQLVEKALQMSYDIGVDVACLYIGIEDTVYKFYNEIGYKFLNRKAYYIDSLGKEKTEDYVMILGLNNKELANKILTTDHKFHYGKEEGCW